MARRGRIADLERELRFKDERINESKDEIDGSASYSGTGGASTCRRGYAAQGRVKQLLDRCIEGIEIRMEDGGSDRMQPFDDHPLASLGSPPTKPQTILVTWTLLQCYRVRPPRSLIYGCQRIKRSNWGQ